MKKSAAIEKAGFPPPLIIIDNREKAQVVKNEAFAISALCRTMMFTDLLTGDIPIDLTVNH